MIREIQSWKNGKYCNEEVNFISPVCCAQSRGVVWWLAPNKSYLMLKYCKGVVPWCWSLTTCGTCGHVVLWSVSANLQTCPLSLLSILSPARLAGGPRYLAIINHCHHHQILTNRNPSQLDPGLVALCLYIKSRQTIFEIIFRETYLIYLINFIHTVGSVLH